MGYTISMHAETAKKQAAMEAFMLRHYRPAHKIFSGRTTSRKDQKG